MCSALRFTTSNCSGSSLNISADICSFQHHPVLIKHHQQTLLRLLGAPEHQEHWEHWDSIGPSRNDQQCPFWSGATRKVMTCLEHHHLSRRGWKSWISQTAYNHCFSWSSWSRCVSRSAQEYTGAHIIPTIYHIAWKGNCMIKL